MTLEIAVASYAYIIESFSLLLGTTYSFDSLMNSLGTIRAELLGSFNTKLETVSEMGTSGLSTAIAELLEFSNPTSFRSELYMFMTCFKNFGVPSLEEIEGMFVFGLAIGADLLTIFIFVRV
jgi:hypothetical protein